MGMLEARMKVAPAGEPAAKTIEKLRKQLDNYFSESDNSCEGYDVRVVRPEEFDELWKVQETYINDNPEITEKYRAFAVEGRLVYVEIDY
jgi:hypothetical protein